jgi:ATP-dependent DNA helicase DinG
MGTAAELFSHHAFVDLETTGLDPSCDRVIELGALFVQGGQAVNRISKLFGSPTPLPVSIRRLTGIEDAALAGQPAFHRFIPELRDALSGWTVVAHNASFERSFLPEILEEIDAPVLDSCELLHYLYPELESYSLESLVRWAGIGDFSAHRALRDCEDTYAMLCRALDRCIEAGRAEEVEEILDSLAPGASRARVEALPILTLLSQLVQRCRRVGSPERNDDARLPRAPPAIGSSRPDSQLRMARWLDSALAREGIAAIEPGGGMAEPIAYAVPAAAFARNNNCRVSIAVGSKSRLARLLGKDLPSLQRSTGEVRYSFLADQRDYLCRRRALDLTATDEWMSHNERAPRAYLRAFLRRSPSGELARLSYWFKDRYPLLERLAFAARSEPQTTLAERCPHFARCFFHSSLARSRNVDILVTQHRLVAEWPPEHPRLRHLVIDEAHHLEGAISAALSRELSDTELARLSDRLLGVNGSGGVLAAVEADLINAVGVEAGALQLRDGARRCRLLALGSPRLFGALSGLLPVDDEQYRRELLLSEGVQKSASWAPVRSMLLELRTHLGEVDAWLSALAEPLPHLSENHPGLERDLAGARAEVQRLLQYAAEFTSPAEAGRCLFVSVDGTANSWSLRSEPLDVSNTFARLVRERSVVLSSPALSVGGTRPWVLERLGVTGEPERISDMVEWKHAAEPLVLLLTDAPRPFDEEFLDWAASRISGIAAFLGGRTMGLFSSNQRLTQIEDRLRPHLERSGIETVRASQARRTGRRQGDQAVGRVLLGSRSLWHRTEAEPGVACAFIDKLLIEPLSRAAVSAREATALRCGADGQYHSMPYRLPRALVVLRHWLSTCTVGFDKKMVVVLAHPGAEQHRDALLAALEGYRSEVVPWSVARLRIYETLRPIAVGPKAARASSSAATA